MQSPLTKYHNLIELFIIDSRYCSLIIDSVNTTTSKPNNSRKLSNNPAKSNKLLFLAKSTIKITSLSSTHNEYLTHYNH